MTSVGNTFLSFVVFKTVFVKLYMLKAQSNYLKYHSCNSFLAIFFSIAFWCMFSGGCLLSFVDVQHVCFFY